MSVFTCATVLYAVAPVRDGTIPDYFLMPSRSMTAR